MRRAVGNNQRGFSLIEAVIAMAILAMIGVIVAGTFGRSVAARDRALAISGRYLQIRNGLLRMSKEIQMAFVSPHKDCDDPRTGTLFVGERATGGMRLDFTSFSHFKMHADANESDQNEISYFIDQDPDDTQKKALFRRVQPRIDDEPEEGGIEQVMIEDVSELEFQFYNDEDDRWEDDWDTERSDYKDSRGKPRLPLFVAINLTAKGSSGEDEEFVTKTRLLLNKPISVGIGLGFTECWE